MKRFPINPLQAPADEGKGGSGGGAAAGGTPAAGANAGAETKGGSEAGGAETKTETKGAPSVLGVPEKKAADDKSEAEKKGEPAKGAEGEKEKANAGDGKTPDLELKLPDGMKLDEGLWTRFKPVAQELGLDSEKASKLAKFHAEAMSEREKAGQDAWNQLRSEWHESLKTDKEFGGKNFEANVALAQKALIRFGGKDLSDELAKYGLDNLPGLAKAFAKIGKEIAEDSSGTETAPTKKANPSREERVVNFYPDMKPRQQR